MARKRKSTRRKKYTVRIPADRVTYGPETKAGAPYTRMGAMTFARIGSAHGSPREVFENGRKIRRYVGGKATYRNPDGWGSFDDLMQEINFLMVESIRRELSEEETVRLNGLVRLLDSLEQEGERPNPMGPPCDWCGVPTWPHDPARVDQESGLFLHDRCVGPRQQALASEERSRPSFGQPPAVRPHGWLVEEVPGGAAQGILSGKRRSRPKAARALLASDKSPIADPEAMAAWKRSRRRRNPGWICWVCRRSNPVDQCVRCNHWVCSSCIDQDSGICDRCLTGESAEIANPKKFSRLGHYGPVDNCARCGTDIRIGIGTQSTRLRVDHPSEWRFTHICDGCLREVDPALAARLAEDDVRRTARFDKVFGTNFGVKKKLNPYRNPYQCRYCGNQTANLGGPECKNCGAMFEDEVFSLDDPVAYPVVRPPGGRLNPTPLCFMLTGQGFCRAQAVGECGSCFRPFCPKHSGGPGLCRECAAGQFDRGGLRANPCSWRK